MVSRNSPRSLNNFFRLALTMDPPAPVAKIMHHAGRAARTNLVIS
jgi:hypothetical protein